MSPFFYVSPSNWVISSTVFGASVTRPNLNEPPRALAVSTIAWVISLLGRCKQKQRGFKGLLCRWHSITEWEVHITAQGPRLRNDLYCVEWDVQTVLYHRPTIPLMGDWKSTRRVSVGMSVAVMRQVAPYVFKSSSCHHGHIHHHLVLQRNPGWFYVLTPGYEGCSGNWPLNRLTLLL